jgi:hypothetical protein
MAVIGAFALIALAIFVRGQLVDDGGGGGSKGSKGDGKAPVVACTPDLASVCDALAADGQIATDPPTLELAEAAEPPAEVDGWITWDPAPQVANFDAGQEAVWGTSEALGSAPLAALADSEAFSYLRSGCTDVDWTCFATRFVGEGFSVGVGDPTTAEGLARLAPLAIALSPDLDPDGLRSEDLRRIVESTTQDEAATMARAATQPALVGMVVGPKGLLDAVADTAQGKSRALGVEVLAPRTTATVVIAPRSGRDLGDVAEACDVDEVAAALRAVGVEPCEDGRGDEDRAGFLYRVREKAS